VTVRADELLTVNYDSKVIVAKDDNAFGLCNQLNDFARLLYLGCLHNVYISIESMKLDLKDDIYGDLGDIVDINATNKKIHDNILKYNCSNIGTDKSLQQTSPIIIAYRDVSKFHPSQVKKMSFDEVRRSKGVNSDMITSFILSDKLIAHSGIVLQNLLYNISVFN